MRRAADALRRFDLPAAIAAYTEVLRSGDSGAELRGTALLGRGLARQLRGDPGAVGDVAEALEEWRKAPPGWTASALGEIAAALEEADPATAAAYWDTAQQLATATGDASAVARIAGERGNRAALAGDWEEASRLLTVAEEWGRRSGEDGVAAAALIGLARIDFEAGATTLAARRTGEAIALARHGPHVEAARWLLCDLASHAVRTGNFDEAEAMLEEALQLSDDGADGLRRRALAALAALAARRRDRDRALGAAGAVLHLARRNNDETELAYALHDIAATALAAGMVDDAARWLGEAVVVAKRHRLTVLVASASRLLAAIALEHADHLRALGYAEQAASLVVDRDELLASATTLHAVGLEAERWRRYDIAQAAQSQAVTLFRGLGEVDRAAEAAQAVARLEAVSLKTEEQRTRVETALDLARRITAHD
jgi:tetratricopeptide (TPR) repeat protein